jgi:hypothetical protein
MVNTLLNVLDERKEDLPQQRLVFFVKHILPYSMVEDANQYMLAEIFKALNQILPLLKDLYGEFWSESISAMCKHLSTTASEISTLHAILRLMGTLRSLIEDDASEDLQDSWTEQKQQLDSSMIRLLALQSRISSFLIIHSRTNRG